MILASTCTTKWKALVIAPVTGDHGPHGRRRYFKLSMNSRASSVTDLELVSLSRNFNVFYNKAKSYKKAEREFANTSTNDIERVTGNNKGVNVSARHEK